MRTILPAAILALFIAGGAWGVFATCGTPHLKLAPATAVEGEMQAAAVAGPTGHFDATMSGVCQFSCAAQQPYAEAELVAQPGAHDGDLTRCPVSGVVFAVDGKRPRVTVSGNDYVVCCGTCAGKLTKTPAKFLTM